MSIPKIIHHCWFGNSKKSQIIVDCFESWNKHLPDYKFMLWNETNSELDNLFIKECYRLKKWAFVSDYIRLKALYEFGGIYLDADMLLLKNLDPFLNETCFFGAESDDFISCGIIGARPENSFINKCLDLYQHMEIPIDNKWYKIAIPQLVTKAFKEYCNFEGNFNDLLILKDIKVYPKEYFYAIPNLNRKISNKDIKFYSNINSYAAHLWHGSWMEQSEFNLISNGNYVEGIKKMFKSIFKEKKGSRNYYKKILTSFKQSLKRLLK